MSVASADTGFYQQNSGSQGTQITQFDGTSSPIFVETEINGVKYQTFQFNNTIDDDFKLFVTADSNKWDSNGFGKKGQLNIQSNSMLVSNQGLAMGNQGTGTLTLDLWTNKNDKSQKSFILDLSNITDLQSYAFYGNLDVTGSSSGSAEDYSNKTVNLKLGGKGIKGNVTFNSLGKSNLIFSDGAGIEGNITVSKGINTLTFNGSNRTYSGNITISGGTTTFLGLTSFQVIASNKNLINIGNGQSVTVNFGSDTNKVNNFIATFNSNARDGNARVYLNFNNISNTLVGNISSSEDTSYGVAQTTVTFRGTQENKIQGNITASGSNYGSTPYVTNIVNFDAGQNNSIIGNVIGGVSTYSGNGTNIVTFGTNSVNALIKGNISGNAGHNTIKFFNSGAQKIEGEITTDTSTFGGSGSNTIYFSQSGAQITGKVEAKFGRNTITFDKGGTIDGNVIVAGRIDADVNSNFNNIIGVTTINGNISVYDTLNYRITNGKNTITFYSPNSSTPNLISGYVEAKGDNGNNIIKNEGSGDLTIGKGVYTIDTFYGRQKGNTISLANGDLSIGKFDSNLAKTDSDTTGNSLHAYNKDNSNIINLGKNGAVFSLSGNIYSGDGGYNTINFNGNRGVIKSSSGNSVSASGTTNINAQSLEIKNGSNTIGTFTTTGGTTSLTLTQKTGGVNGNVSTTSGMTNVIFGQDNGTFSFVGNFSTANGGKNIFNLSNKNETISTNLNFSGDSSITGDGGNIVNIGAGKTLTLGNTQTHTAIITSGGATYINLDGALANLDGNVSTSGGTAHINFKQSGKVSRNIGTSGSGITEILLANVQLDAQIQGQVTTTSGETKIKFADGNNEKNLTLASNGNTITSIALADGTQATTNNNLTLLQGNTSIVSKVTIAHSQALAFNLENANLTLQDGLDNSGSGTVNFNGSNGVLNGNISTKNSGQTTINVADTNAIINGMVNGSANIVHLKGNGTGYGATLTLGGSNNTLKTLVLENNSTNNTLALTNGKTTITDQVKVGESSNQELSLVLGNNTELALARGLTTQQQSGTSILKVKNATDQATLSGKAVALTRLELMTEGNTTSTLLFKNTTTTIDELFSSKGENVLKMADGSTSVTLNSSAEGTKFSLDFADSGNTQAKTFTLTGGENTIKTLSVSDTATSNTLAVTGGHTTILDAINIGSGKNITLKLTSGTTTASDSRLTLDKAVASDGTVNILFDGGVNPADQIHHSTLFLKGANNQINSVTSNATNAVIAFDGTAGATIENVTINGTDASKSGSLVFGFIGGGAIDVKQVKLGSSASATLNIQGSTATINKLVFQNGSTLGLSNAQTTINSAIDSTSTKLNIKMADSTLILGHSSNSLDNLTSTNGLVDLTQGKGVTKARSAVQTNTNARNTLTIGNFTGDAIFKLFASSQNADQVIFKNPAPAPYAAGVDATPTNTATIVVVGGSDIYNITYDPTKNDNIMVADVSGANGQVDVVGGKSMIGISEVQVQLTEGTSVDSRGNGKYYIGSIKDLGLKQEYQEVATSALTVNYDLYLANFNSLNKRMGELRDNPHSQGVWARVFGGNMSNDFGSGSKTDYITAQAGYDYALSVGENAKNYVGVAIAYGTSKTKGNTLDISAIGAPTNSISLSNVDSNMVEVGIYNSYVMDSGWYNDTIFKFDYIMSEFSLSNDPNQMSNTNNFAIVLSDEFGYRYKFAENEKGNWYIDPQVEVAFGYFNQSDFNRAMYESGVFTGSTIQASQDSIITLRTKAGLSLGKKFITEKGFASLYVGAFYEYDYINGGDAEATGRAGGSVTQLDKVESNGRAIVNVGSNIGLSESARLYIDVEKSFGDKQRTFMQFNFGARYSF